MTESTAPTPIGWRERVDLPDWGLRRIKAKVDTGARTSAIDVAQIEELPDGRIRFEVVYRLLPKRRTRWIEAVPTRRTVVKSSRGQRHERFVCTTRLRIGPFEQLVEVNLVGRRGMLTRILIGRRALAGRFVVDPARINVLSARPSYPGPDDRPDANPSPGRPLA